MSTFTLAIACLTTSNLPWFMDLTFQVPMQYCSLQHRTLLLSPVPSTTGYFFCVDSIPSLFLELFLHWSPLAYWAPTDLGSSSFSILSIFSAVAEKSYHTQGQGQQPRGNTPLPRSSCCAGAGGMRGATPHSRSGGSVIRGYPSFKVRSSGCALLEQPWRDSPHPR